MIQDLLRKLRTHYTGLISIDVSFSMESDDNIEVSWGLYVDGRCTTYPSYAALRSYVYDITSDINNVASAEITIAGSINPEEIDGRE